MKAEQDLNSQQDHLASIDYDLRISNLARFIHKKIRNHFSINSSVSDHQKINLMDIGAGNGIFLKFFKNHGIKVSGIEYEQHLVDTMRKDPDLKNVSISQGDITKIKGKEEYDVVISSDVIEHIKDHEKAIENLWSFVAPGGILLITVPAHSFLYGKRDTAWGHFRRYDKSLLRSKIEHLESGTIEFLTFWNFIGFFVYFLYEKILHKQINEEIRYGNSFKNKMIRKILDSILRFEELLGGSVLGLTLITGVKKKK